MPPLWAGMTLWDEPWDLNSKVLKVALLSPSRRHPDPGASLWPCPSGCQFLGLPTTLVVPCQEASLAVPSIKHSIPGPEEADSEPGDTFHLWSKDTALPFLWLRPQVFSGVLRSLCRLFWRPVHTPVPKLTPSAPREAAFRVNRQPEGVKAASGLAHGEPRLALSTGQ